MINFLDREQINHKREMRGAEMDIGRITGKYSRLQEVEDPEDKGAPKRISSSNMSKIHGAVNEAAKLLSKVAEISRTRVEKFSAKSSEHAGKLIQQSTQQLTASLGKIYKSIANVLKSTVKSLDHQINELKGSKLFSGKSATYGPMTYEEFTKKNPVFGPLNFHESVAKDKKYLDENYTDKNQLNKMKQAPTTAKNKDLQELALRAKSEYKSYLKGFDSIPIDQYKRTDKKFLEKQEGKKDHYDVSKFDPGFLRDEAVGLKESLESELKDPKAKNLQQLNKRIASYNDRLETLTKELRKAVHVSAKLEIPDAEPKDKYAAKFMEKVQQSKSYRTIPKTGRDLDQEIRNVKSALKTAQKEVKIIEDREAALLNKVKANQEKHEAATARREMVKTQGDTRHAKQLEREAKAPEVANAGNKVKIKQADGSIKEIVHGDPRARAKHFDAVRRANQTATSRTAVARRAIKNAEQQLKTHDDNKPWLLGKTEHKYNRLRLGDKLENKQEKLEEARSLEKDFQTRDVDSFDKDVKYETGVARQKPTKFSGSFEVSKDFEAKFEKAMSDLTDAEIASLKKEGEELFKKAEDKRNTYTPLSAKEYMARKASPANQLDRSTFAGKDKDADMAAVKNLLKNAFAQALASEQEALSLNPEDLIKAVRAPETKDDFNLRNRVVNIIAESV